MKDNENSKSPESQLVEVQFEDLRSLLGKVKARYFPHPNELNLGPIKQPDLNLFENLLFLSQLGLDAVNRNRNFFLCHHLYEDGMFWFDLFSTIDTSCWQCGENGYIIPSAQETIQRLAVIMIEMLEYSTAQPGDITDRNEEALESILSVFCCPDLINIAKNKISELQHSQKVGPGCKQMVSEIIAKSLESAIRLINEQINKLKQNIQS